MKTISLANVEKEIQEWLDDKAHLAPAAGMDRIMRKIAGLNTDQLLEICQQFGLAPMAKQYFTADGSRLALRAKLVAAKSLKDAA